MIQTTYVVFSLVARVTDRVRDQELHTFVHTYVHMKFVPWWSIIFELADM